MNLINTNPYRIIGILANASARELQSRKGKISAYAKVGKEITSEFDFSFLGSLQRNNDTIDEAFSAIEQNHDKVIHSLFWFLNLNSIDDTAIQHLISGDKEKAIEIWERVTEGKEITSKNYSSFNNLSTLCLSDNRIVFVKEGIKLKIALIESDSFINFVHTIADETYSIDKNKLVEELVDNLLFEFKKIYSIAEILDLFSISGINALKYLSKRLSEEPIHKIESAIELCSTKSKKDNLKANVYAKELYNSAKSDLSLLKTIFGIGNLRYIKLADNVSKELLQCSTVYYNKCQELELDIDYLEESVKISKLANEIAASEVTKSKVKEDLKLLESFKDRELQDAIDFLKSIKKAYEEACFKIDKEVNKLRYNELDNGLQLPKYDVSINWSKIDELKRNALDWNKVIDLLKEVIPEKNIEKIKLSKNSKDLEEFKSLVEFLFKKLNPSQKRKIEYLNYWKKNIEKSEAKLKTVEKKNVLDIIGPILFMPFYIAYYIAIPWLIICAIFFDFSFSEALLYGVYISVIIGIIVGVIISKDEIK